MKATMPPHSKKYFSNNQPAVARASGNSISEQKWRQRQHLSESNGATKFKKNSLNNRPVVLLIMTLARSGGVEVTASHSIDATDEGDGIPLFDVQGDINLAATSSCSSAVWCCHCPALRFIALRTVA